jgi:hypothetical protein
VVELRLVLAPVLLGLLLGLLPHDQRAAGHESLVCRSTARGGPNLAVL